MMLRVLLPLLLALPLAAAADGVVRIEADESVEGAAITLGEIAVLDGLPAELRERVSALSLGQSAPPASHRSFSGQAVRERIAQLDPALVLDIPDQVRVHTAYREIGEAYLRERLEQALRLRLPWPTTAVRLSHWRLPEPFPVPARARRLVVHFRSGEDFLGRVNIETEIFDASRPDVPHVRRSASVEVEVRLPVVVTKRRLRRGEIVEQDAVRLEERDLRVMPRGVITDLQEVLGRRLQRGTGDGTPLLLGHLETESIVKRGDIIVVQAGGNGLDVRVEARALETGAEGQMIRLENPTTRRRFLAQITGPGSATLALPGVGAGP